VACVLPVVGAVVGICLGIALGVWAVLRRGLLAPGLAPFSSLLVTLRPLVLPLLAVILVGLLQADWWIPVLGTTVLTFLALRFILMPEGPRKPPELRWDRWLLRTLGRNAVLFGAFLLTLAIVLFIVVSTRYFESIGGVTAFSLVLALVLWTFAFLSRFVSYASSWLRSFVALLVVLTGLRLAAAIGLLPGDDWLDDQASCLEIGLPIAAGVLLLLEAVLDVVAPWHEDRPRRDAGKGPKLSTVLRIRNAALLDEDALEAAQGLGLALALLASAAIAATAIFGLFETAQPGETLSVESSQLARDAPDPASPARFQSDVDLERAYAPVLALTREERWSPVAADGYARRATLSGPTVEPLANPRSVREKLDRACPRLASSPCYRLSIRCPLGRADCARANPHPDRSSERLYREGAVYVRVMRKSLEEEEERRREAEKLRPSDRWPPRVFVDEGPFRKRLTTLLQYWYFYPYDEWEANVFAGQLVQRHEGDWEAVTIGLSDAEPLFVAYSAHCAGTWRAWRGVEISKKLPEPTHPLVAVAEGSHANYPSAGQKHVPDTAYCQGLPKGTTTLLGYASDIRDRTEYGWQWYPADSGWLTADIAEPPMSFPGYWGADESTTLYGFFKENPIAKGHGPETPTLQALWREPVTKIFCSNYTGPDGDYECKE
jgi:hypothetical protein